MKKCSLNTMSVKLSIDFHYRLLVWCERVELGTTASRCCHGEHLLFPLQAEPESTLKATGKH